MADAKNTPVTITLSSTVSTAALDTAVNAEIITLLAAGANSLTLLNMTTAVVSSTLTYIRCINYSMFIVPSIS